MAEDNLNDGSRSKRTSDMYAGDIPVLSELASLIGSLDIDTPAKLRGSRYSDKAVAEELAQVRTTIYLSITWMIYSAFSSHVFHTGKS